MLAVFPACDSAPGSNPSHGRLPAMMTGKSTRTELYAEHHPLQSVEYAHPEKIVPEVRLPLRYRQSPGGTVSTQLITASQP